MEVEFLGARPYGGMVPGCPSCEHTVCQTVSWGFAPLILGGILPLPMSPCESEHLFIYPVIPSQTFTKDGWGPGHGKTQ
jgi:hypothetical protein